MWPTKAGRGPSDFTLVPDLALKADVSKDGRVYTIALRPGVRWESRAPINGRELVAADPDAQLTVDLAEESILLPDGTTIDFLGNQTFSPEQIDWFASTQPEASATTRR